MIIQGNTHLNKDLRSRKRGGLIDLHAHDRGRNRETMSWLVAFDTGMELRDWVMRIVGE